MIFKRILNFILTFTLIFSSLTVNAFSQDDILSNDEWEPKQYSDVTIDYDFCGSSVLVVMDRRVGGFNKIHEPSFFGDFPIENIYDLTASKFDLKEYNQGADRAACSEWRQILSISLPFNSKQKVLEIIRKLEKVDGIKSVEPNFYLESTSIPIDPYYQHPNPNTFDGMGQWALEKINAPYAWSITTGNSDVRVGVIDTDIMEHEDLNANVDMELGGFFYCGDIYPPLSLWDPYIDGHGTKVSGPIGAEWNDIGVAGICQNVTLVPLDIETYAQSSYTVRGFVIEAVDYATESYLTNTPIQILNVSLGLDVDYNDELEYAIAQYPGLLVSGAGNGGGDNDNLHYAMYPASYNLPNVISVGATDINDQLSDWGDGFSTNYGANTVHLFAPGTNVLTTCAKWSALYDKCSKNCYSTEQSPYCLSGGTSLAAPHVAGVAALLLSAYPNATTAQIKQAILLGVDELPQLDGKCITGGRLNAYKALQEIRSIVEIKGVQYSTSLTTLYIYTLGLTNAQIEPLKYMANLRVLELGNNQISNPTPLKGLINLQALYLEYNQINDLTPLKGLTNLQALWLQHNQINDITPLSGLTKMRELVLNNNQISNTISLSNLTNLDYLDLRNNLISYLTPLSHLKLLRSLELNNNQIRNLTPLYSMTKLQYLDLRNNPITLAQVNALKATLAPNCTVYHNAI